MVSPYSNDAALLGKCDWNGLSTQLYDKMQICVNQFNQTQRIKDLHMTNQMLSYHKLITRPYVPLFILGIGFLSVGKFIRSRKKS